MLIMRRRCQGGYASCQAFVVDRPATGDDALVRTTRMARRACLFVDSERRPIIELEQMNILPIQ